MAIAKAFWRWVHRRRRDRTERAAHLDEELGFHLDRQIEANLAAGMPAVEARRVALLEFGGVEQIKEECRDQRRWAWLDDLGLDIRYGARMLRASPGFTAFALITIALCLGANAAIFSLVDGVLLKASGFRDPERIVFLWESAPKLTPENNVAGGTFNTWVAQSQSFEALAADTGEVATYTGGALPRPLLTAKVSAAYFDVLGTHAVLGRTFARGEDQPGRDKVVVLSHRIWQDLFGADATLIGRSIILDRQPHTVIGVLGVDDRSARHKQDLFVPLVIPASAAVDWYVFSVMAKLRPGVTVAQAQAELSAIAARTAERHPIKKGWGATVVPYLDRVVGSDTRRSLWLLMAAVFVVLLIGCANLANLMLARATLRGREIALRLAIGAGRARLVRMLLSESLLLAMLGAAVGALVGYVLLAWIQSLLPPDHLPVESHVAMDGRVLAFLAAATLLTTVAFGLVPALRAARQDPNQARDEGGHGQSAGRSRVHARQIFIAIQIAIAFVLLAGGGLLLRSLERVMNVATGFDTEGVIVAHLPMVDEGREPDPATLIRYGQRVVDEVRAEPGIVEVGLAFGLPLSGWGIGTRIGVGKDGEILHIGFKIVTPGYFRALGMRPLRGRLLDEGDRAGAPRVVVVNQSFVNRYLPDTEPIGHQISVRQNLPRGQGAAVPWRIVGVVADEKAEGLEENDDFGVYGSFEQSPVESPGLVVKGKGDPAALIQAAQRAVSRVNPEQALLWPKSLRDLKAEQTQPRRLTTLLLGGFALLALLLAAAGTYAVVAFVTAARTHELGIRAALGASRSHLLWQTLGGVAKPVVVGAALGLGGALALSRAIAAMLFATDPLDVPNLLVTAALLVPVALAAGLIPSWRAVRAKPLTALRQD